MVMLGKQGHGDGAAFAAKARIVEHLHRRLGFDVLAFEADFFALERAWSHVRDAAAVADLARHVYAFWKAPAAAPLWELVRERAGSERPLAVTGIDPRHTGAYNMQAVVRGLEAHLGTRSLPLPCDWHWFRATVTDLLEREYGHRLGANGRSRFFETLARLGDMLDGEDEVDAFWRQELRNLAFTARNAWGLGGRDEGMGSNLAWLATARHPGRRIIVWTHNFHVARSAAALDACHPPYARERREHPDVPLGEVAVSELGDVVRCVALIAGRGWHSPRAWQGDTSTRAELAPPPAGSLEAELLTRDLACGYLDLRWVDASFTMCGVEHGVPVTAPWGRVFDGVVYLRDMFGLASSAG